MGFGKSKVPVSQKSQVMMSDFSAEALGPGSVIGILGGGQLGRMLALAAAELGLVCHVYAPPGDNPAFDVAARHTARPYEDEAALEKFAADVDVVTFEFENIPDACLAYLKQRVPVRPDVKVLSITQDRIDEKNLAVSLGIAVPEFVAVSTVAELTAAVDRIGRPCVLKTRRFGYDGKGQCVIGPESNLAQCFSVIGAVPGIVEAFVPFEKEISVVAARDVSGAIAVYDIPENRHENHILASSHVPADISPAAKKKAIEIAGKLADAMGYVGVFAVELFLLPDGAGEAVMMNEIAPRVHNSGHWTQDACHVSQFEQHIRAVAGLPLADPLRHSDAVMFNLLGKDGLALAELARRENTSIHLYGKQSARPGRKMGHVTQLFSKKR
jgi:5-(carboxyamino)imidazole ribonucleotide synthase